jgi:hypothetical protein
VPVHVPVCLLAPKTEDVHTLRRDSLGERLSNTPDNPLKRKVLVFREIGGYLLPMFARSNERIAVESRLLAQKRNRELVFEKHVMGCTRGCG